MSTVIVNVAQAPLTITADSQTKTYGRAVTFAGTEFMASGLVNGDRVTSVTMSSPGAAATADVSGSPYPIIPGAAVGTGLSNYSITDANGTLTVNPAALTITANDATIAAGQSIPSFSVQYSGFVPGQGPGVLSGTLSLSSSATAGSPPGRYPIVPSGLTSSNYAITYVTGTLTITSAPMPIPFVTVTGVQWETLKVSRKKSARELVVSFSGGLNSADADDLAAYALDSAKRVKKSTVYTKPVPLASALYNAGTNTVTLRLRGKPPAQTMQLTVNGGLGARRGGASAGRQRPARRQFCRHPARRWVISMTRLDTGSGTGRIANAATDAKMADGLIPRELHGVLEAAGAQCVALRHKSLQLDELQHNKWRRRELHPRPRFRKSFRSMILASNRDASGCTMSALTRHYRSLSPLGMAWHRKSGKRSWDWRDLLEV